MYWSFIELYDGPDDNYSAQACLAAGQQIQLLGLVASIINLLARHLSTRFGTFPSNVCLNAKCSV